MGLLSKFRKQKKQYDYKEEIVEHLTDLLNTKKEFGSCPRDYGLGSYIYLGSNNKIVLQIISDIKTCLEKYERRVHDVEILPAANENRFFLSFVIKCKIENQRCSFHLSFHQQQNTYSLEVKE